MEGHPFVLHSHDISRHIFISMTIQCPENSSFKIFAVDLFYSGLHNLAHEVYFQFIFPISNCKCNVLELKFADSGILTVVFH